MQTFTNKDFTELTPGQVEQVSGGVIFVPVLYAAFVSGAKWGGGLALGAYLIHSKFH